MCSMSRRRCKVWRQVPTKRAGLSCSAHLFSYLLILLPVECSKIRQLKQGRQVKRRRRSWGGLGVKRRSCIRTESRWVDFLGLCRSIYSPYSWKWSPSWISLCLTWYSLLCESRILLIQKQALQVPQCRSCQFYFQQYPNDFTSINYSLKKFLNSSPNNYWISWRGLELCTRWSMSISNWHSSKFKSPRYWLDCTLSPCWCHSALDWTYWS